jgi:glycosyltransferase involved in cell wall biosynthesis
LIPVYNYDIRDLAEGLHAQAMASGEPFEIIIMDDKSTDQYRSVNQSVKNFEHINYIELEHNIGRSKIRNKMADFAQYNHFLFIDCDSKLDSGFYVKDYILNSKKELVVYGGRKYENTMPADPIYRLHWKFGKNREELTADVRQLKSNCSFMTNNVLIARDIFEQNRFNETLRRYGHEDTLFGLELRKQKVHVKHIENALIHAGLEDADTFISKTKQGIRNLRHIYKQKGNDRYIVNNISLLKYYVFLRKTGLYKVIRFMFNYTEKMLLKNLKSENPRLFLFDLYKLGYMCAIT